MGHARIQKIFSEGVQIPRRGLTENFNMAKINNLAIPGGGVRTPCPPPPPKDPLMRDQLQSDMGLHYLKKPIRLKALEIVLKCH